MRKLLLAITVLCMWIVPTAGAAQVAAPAVQAQARQQVEAQSNAVGVAPNEAQAQQDQRTLAPAVNRAIAAGAGPELMASKNPSVLADVLQHVSMTEVHGTPSLIKRPGTGGIGSAQIARRRVRAHAAGCWNGVWDQWYWRTPWGSTIGWLYVALSVWCGDGYAISYDAGVTLATWAWGPYCMSNVFHANAWDYWPVWIHMGQWGSLGVPYPWGCAGLKGGHAILRVAGNGYWDTYDDFGI